MKITRHWRFAEELRTSLKLAEEVRQTIQVEIKQSSRAKFQANGMDFDCLELQKELEKRFDELFGSLNNGNDN